LARSRMLKPSFFRNEKIVARGPWARLLLQGLWCLADRRGVLKDKPQWIKMELFPADSIDIDATLNELAEVRDDEDRPLIVRYEAVGKRCIVITGFDQHARPHPDEPANDLPDPPESNQQAASRPVVVASTTVAVPTSNGETVKKHGEPGKNTGGCALSSSYSSSPSLTLSTHPGETPVGFAAWWSAYPTSPRKVAKAKCLREWKRRKLEPIAENVIASLERCKVSRDWTKDHGEFIPMPLTWLNRAPWETEPAEMAEPTSPDGDAADFVSPTDEQLEDYRRAMQEVDHA
jgi:hypothetical protein